MSIEAQGSDSWIKVVQLYHYYYSLQFKEETAVLSFLLLVSHQQHAMHVFKNTARVTCGLKLRVTFCKIVLYLSLIASTLIRNSSGVPICMHLTLIQRPHGLKQTCLYYFPIHPAEIVIYSHFSLELVQIPILKK